MLWTVEKTYRRRWNEVLATADSNSGWDCQKYLSAIESDKYYFDNNYIYSKDTYQAPYRGRGLIQLTLCSNYLHFFYNQAALDVNQSYLLKRLDSYFYYTDERRALIQKRSETFCSSHMLDNIEDFKNDGLPLNFENLLNIPGFNTTLDSFERAVNELSLPCQGRGFSDMSSIEFLVDSSLNYWRECRFTKGRDTTTVSAEAVAEISSCIMGSPRIFRTFRASHCEQGKVSDEGRSTVRNQSFLRRYCSRLHNFNILNDVFSKSSESFEQCKRISD